MELVLHSSYGPLALQPSLPHGWNGNLLCGGMSYSHEANFGSICIQRFEDEKFSICYIVLRFLKKVKLAWSEEPLLRLQYLMQGGFRYKLEPEKLVRLRTGQVNAVWAPGRETTAHFSKGNYEMLLIGFKPELVQELLPRFPGVRSFAEENYKKWISTENKNRIYEILNVPYTDNTRRFFYETKVREYLLSFLLPSHPQGLERYNETEIERIRAVESLILKDLTKHHSSKELAAIAKMPEARLIEGFRDVVGVTMFERYKEAKLQKAKKYLLETDIQVKVLYEIVGYDSYTGFVEAFTERFGLSPLRFRKKYRPFD